MDGLLVVVCLLGGLTLRCSHLLLQVWDEEAACEAKVLGGRVGDDFGPSGGLSERWLNLPNRSYYFDGANRIWDGCCGDHPMGDDIYLSKSYREYSLVAHLGSLPPLGFLGLLVGVLWLRRSPWSGRERSTSPAREAANTLFVASVPLGLSGLALWWARAEPLTWSRPWWAWLEALPMASSPPVAAGLTLVLVSLLAAMIVRACALEPSQRDSPSERREAVAWGLVRGHTAWRRLTRVERLLLGLALLLILGAALLRPGLRLAWPELAVECALRQGEEVDPWGRPFVSWMKEGFSMICYSCGPNGVDQAGWGDDIWGRAGSFPFAADPDHLGWSLLGLLLAPPLLLGSGVMLAWAVAVRRLWRAARSSVCWELLWAGVLAFVPIVLIWSTVSALWTQPDWNEVPVFGPLMVPVQAAFACTMSLVVYSAALWRRLNRGPRGSTRGTTSRSRRPRGGARSEPYADLSGRVARTSKNARHSRHICP